MTPDGGAIQSFLATATAGEVLLQIGVIGASGLAAVGTTGIARRWRSRNLALLNLRGPRARLIEITLIEAPVEFTTKQPDSNAWWRMVTSIWSAKIGPTSEPGNCATWISSCCAINA